MQENYYLNSNIGMSPGLEYGVFEFHIFAAGSSGSKPALLVIFGNGCSNSSKDEEQSFPGLFFWNAFFMTKSPREPAVSGTHQSSWSHTLYFLMLDHRAEGLSVTWMPVHVLAPTTSAWSRPWVTLDLRGLHSCLCGSGTSDSHGTKARFI